MLSAMPEKDAKQPYIGGQAVIEGVMMRSPGGLSVAVRRPDGSLVVREEAYQSRFQSKAWKVPFLRGIGVLVESLSMGFRALNFSADQQMTDEEREQASGAGGKLAMVLSTVFALGLFIALPQLLASGSGRLFGIDFGLSDANYHIVIGGFKLLIVFGYLVAISRIPEIRRVFQYHGAEHMTINAYEQELPLTVENVRAQTTMHPRCGTTFLVVVVIVSIVVGSIAAPLLLPDAEGIIGWVAILALRLGLLPVIAGLSYELQRLSARYATQGPLRVFLLPGFLFQKISTRRPDDDQIEVAIAAMEAAAWRDRVGAEAPSDEELLVFPSFDGFMDALPTLRPLQNT